MQSAKRKIQREEIEREIKGVEFVKLLHAVQQREPALQRFDSWTTVLKFTRGQRDVEVRDAVLSALKREFHASGDTRWHSILLAVFWPALDAIYNRTRSWDGDSEELWQNILLTFTEVLNSTKVAIEHRCTARQILNATMHKLHDLYRRYWRRQLVEIPVKPGHLSELAGSAECVYLQSVDMFDGIVASHQRFNSHCAARRITPQQASILLFTRVLGARLCDYCRRTCLNYQLAKKWRQRAEASLRKFEIV